MLTSNLWALIGFQNGARGKVIGFVYMNLDGPRYQTFPEAVVLQFGHIEPDMPDFLEDFPVIVAITTITAEWIKPSNNGVFTSTQFPLNLS